MWKAKEFGLFILVLCAVFVVSAWYPISKESNRNVEMPMATPFAKLQACGQVLEENKIYLVEQEQIAERQRQEEEQKREQAKKQEQKKIQEKRRLRQERKKKQAEKRAYQQRQTSILERIVEAEAGDQDLQGRIMVANVVLNRVRSSNFPNSIERVVFARGQFSPVSNGRYDSVTVSDLSKRAAKEALAGVDYSHGALYFMCRSASNPRNVSWFDRDLTKVVEHGCHEFFR